MNHQAGVVKVQQKLKSSERLRKKYQKNINRIQVLPKNNISRLEKRISEEVNKLN